MSGPAGLDQTPSDQEICPASSSTGMEGASALEAHAGGGASDTDPGMLRLPKKTIANRQVLLSGEHSGKCFPTTKLTKFMERVIEWSRHFEVSVGCSEDISWVCF